VAMESVSYRFAAIYDQLKTVARIREVIASGGALRASHVWTRMIADILAANISLPDTREASSRGAVLLALESIGSIDSIEKLGPPPGVMFSYDKKRHSLYMRARKTHEKFYELLVENAPEI
ncbi:MAG: FGGY-family carbohydrate kinase, partial [Acidobacteriota bacterium]